MDKIFIRRLRELTTLLRDDPTVLPRIEEILYLFEEYKQWNNGNHLEQ